ncbi:MAG: metallophosphoesterase [Bacteroidales bacterium]|nr:metallophosphoesterase [Candidatus Scybalocola fimicaballi]
MSKICVVPDIHGREFWKKAMNFDGEIVFLGDFFDPYPSEKDVELDIDSLIKNFEEIRTFASGNERVHLLWGNHDYHYLQLGYVEGASRFDILNCEKINIALEKAEASFAIAIDGVLFTHACLNKHWVGQELKDADDAAKFINSQPTPRLWEVSPKRGGFDDYSSPIWMDINEVRKTNQFDFMQVCGHTKLDKVGTIKNVGNVWCVDSRCCFIVDTKSKTVEVME